MKQWLYLASDLHQKGSEYRHQRDDARSYDSCWIMKFKPEARCCRFWAWFLANITNILSTLFTANCSSSPLCLYMLFGGRPKKLLSDFTSMMSKKFFEKAILLCRHLAFTFVCRRKKYFLWTDWNILLVSSLLTPDATWIVLLSQWTIFFWPWLWVKCFNNSFRQF